MSREIAEYLLECVKDANPMSSGQFNSKIIIKNTTKLNVIMALNGSTDTVLQKMGHVY